MIADTILQGDCLEVLKTLEDESVDCCVTSPPYYGLRDYGMSEQIGLEESPGQYISKLRMVFAEVHRVLKSDGTLWVNIGDSYAGNCSRTSTGRAGLGLPREGIFERVGGKHKDLIGIPWMLAFALREDGWYLRQDIIWAKPNPMPESVKDRCTKSHEYIFLLSKKPKYYFDYEAIQEDAIWKDDKRLTAGRIEYDGKRSEGTDMHAQKSFVGSYVKKADGEEGEVYPVRNKRDVWNVAVQPVKEAHFATYPEALIEPCILAGCKPGGVVLDPFFGSGTTGRVALKNNRHYIGIELNPDYIEIAKRRTDNVQTKLF